MSSCTAPVPVKTLYTTELCFNNCVDDRHLATINGAYITHWFHLNTEEEESTPSTYYVRACTRSSLKDGCCTGVRQGQGKLYSNHGATHPSHRSNTSPYPRGHTPQPPQQHLPCTRSHLLLSTSISSSSGLSPPDLSPSGLSLSTSSPPLAEVSLDISFCSALAKECTSAQERARHCSV